MRLCSEEKLLCNQTAPTARTHWDKFWSRLAIPCRIVCLSCSGSQQIAIAAMLLLHTSKFTCLGPLYAARRREWQIPSEAEQAQQFELITCLQENTREHWIMKQPVVADTLLLTHECALLDHCSMHGHKCWAAWLWIHMNLHDQNSITIASHARHATLNATLSHLPDPRDYAS